MCFDHYCQRSLRPEHEGFESSVSFGTTVFRPSLEKSKSGEDKDLSETQFAAYKPAYKENQIEGENFTSKLPPELSEIMAIWPELPSATRSAIVAIVRASSEL